MFYEDLQYDVLGCADINHIFFTTFLHMITENIRETSLVAQRLKRLPPMWETQVQSLDWEDPLEKEMATYSSILAWRIPWIEEPGRLQSTGSQRVGHDWGTSLSLSQRTLYLVQVFMDQKAKEVCFCVYTDPYIYVYIYVCMYIYMHTTYTHMCKHTYMSFFKTNNLKSL